MPVMFFLWIEYLIFESFGESQEETDFLPCPKPEKGIALIEDGDDCRILGMVPPVHFPVRYTFDNELEKWCSSNRDLPCFDENEMLEKGFQQEHVDNWWDFQQVFYIFFDCSKLQAAGVEIRDGPGQKWNAVTVCFEEVQKPCESSHWVQLTQEWKSQCSCGSKKYKFDFDSSWTKTSHVIKKSDIDCLFTIGGGPFCSCKCYCQHCWRYYDPSDPIKTAEHQFIESEKKGCDGYFLCQSERFIQPD